MKKYKLIFLLVALFFIGFKASATHIIGGEVNYKYLGSNNYEISITMYRDCLTGQADYDVNANVGIFDASGAPLQLLSVPFPGSDTVKAEINYHCGIDNLDSLAATICVERAIYTFQVNLPPRAGGYTIAYQRCCRNAGILNIMNPDDTGDTFLAQIPDTALYGHDSNPAFINWPPAFVCQNLPISIDHSAIDIDGDSLVYALCTPYEGASTLNPMPLTLPEFTPLFTSVVWKNPPYSESDMLGGTPKLTIDPRTGLLTGIATTLGRFVVGVCVEEYRNGIMIGETKRDFQFNVAPCKLSIISSFLVPNILCDGNVQFTNMSTGATSFHWDFGIDSLANDTSNVRDAAYFYSKYGEYTVTLVAADSNCKDTSRIKITVSPVLSVDAGSDKYICENAISGVQIGSADASSDKYTWSPSEGLSDATISNPIALPSVTTKYTVIRTRGVCTAMDSMVVYLTPKPEANITTSFNPECEKIVAQFNSTSAPVTNVMWNFSNGFSSPDPNITCNFNYGDSVDIWLYAYNHDCMDTFYLRNPLKFSFLIELPPPNVITPSMKDGLNDCFKLKTTPGFEDCYTLKVYNRWGKKVFEKDADHKCWDGKNQYSGSELSEGTYFYVITTGNKETQGTVTIIGK